MKKIIILLLISISGIAQVKVVSKSGKLIDVNSPASTTSQGVVKLAGDLSGTADTPRIVDGAVTDNKVATGISKSKVGLGNVDNTSDLNKPISTATQAALDLKANLNSPTFNGTPLAPTATQGTNNTQIATTEFVNLVANGLKFKYNKEWHIDPVNGSDGNTGGISDPFKTISFALTKVGNTAEVLYLHAGTYNESVTFNKLNVDIIGSSYGGNVNLTGNWNINSSSSSNRIFGCSFSNLTHSGNGSLYLYNTKISYFEKTGVSYLELNNVEAQGSGFKILSSGITSINGGKFNYLRVDGGSQAVVSINSCINITSLLVFNGMLNCKNSTIFSVTNNSSAVDINPTGIFIAENVGIYNPDGTLGKISSNGTYSLSNVKYDPSSILGTQLSQTAYFDAIKSNYIIADNIPTSLTATEMLVINPTTKAVEKKTIPTSGSQSVVVRKTSDYTLTENDSVVLCDTSAIGFTISLPNASTNLNKIYTITKVDQSDNLLSFSPPIQLDEATTASSMNYAMTIKVVSDGVKWYMMN